MTKVKINNDLILILKFEFIKSYLKLLITITIKQKKVYNCVTIVKFATKIIKIII